MKFYRVGFFVLLILILSGGAYYLGTLSDKVPESKSGTFTKNSIKEKTEKNATVEEISPTAQTMTLDELKENIKAALETKNTQSFETYMADKVNVILEATECCGIKDRIDAVKQLEYLNDAESPWNFDQTNETIKKIKQTEPQKYGPDSSYVGIAANEFTVSFKFDTNNKISDVTMAATYKLILP